MSIKMERIMKINLFQINENKQFLPNISLSVVSLALMITTSNFAYSDSIKINNKYDNQYEETLKFSEKSIKDVKKQNKKICKSTKIDWDSVVEETVIPVQEKLLYVGTINQGGEEDPDMMLVIGVDPENRQEYGKIIHRVDMPYIGDEVHHFGYNADRTKMIVPGLFSSRMHIVNLSNPKAPFVESVYEGLVEDSKYRDPHTVIGASKR